MTNPIDLKTLAARESEQVEWKENVGDVKSVVKTIVAFANDWSNLGGGYVVCGAREDRDEHGFQKMVTPGLTASRLKEVSGRVSSMCSRFVDPPIVPLVEELPADSPDRRILVFVVPATGAAHTFRTAKDSGKYYIRVDRTTREARNSGLRELLVRKRQLAPWDRRSHPQAGLGDLDLVAFRDALQRMKLWDPAKSLDDYFAPEAQLSPFMPSFCQREPLSGELRPRHFTLLLFGREVQRFFPGAYSVFSVYPGSDRSEPYAKRVMLAGNILDQVRKLKDLVTTQAFGIIDKTRREPNLVKYPRRALEESVVNAVAHRDYESDQPIRVTVFADRVEVFSPGSLVSAVDREKFLAGRQTPVWRNQALAWLFNRLQLAQAEGQGIATIFRTMREEGCPPPTFEINRESLGCVLHAHPRSALVRDGPAS